MRAQEAGTEVGHPAVIVRAFQDEPVKLVALGECDGYVEVAGAIGGATIRFPYAYVYQYDPDTYVSLRAAYENGDHVTLSSLWKSLHHADVPGLTS
jgi:hypothetical protein